MAKSFMENLMNAPRDLAKEMKGLMKPKPREASPARGTDRQAEVSRKFAPLYAEDRRKADLRAEEVRQHIAERLQRSQEMEEFLGGPSPSERGARLASVRESGPAQPISLDRARLLSRRDMLLNARAGMNAERRKSTDAEIARIDSELRAA